jgi:hypothetical protein
MMTMSAEYRLEKAREYIASGLSLIPIGENSKSTPQGFGWTTYQHRRPNDHELCAWVNKYPGLGVVSGKVSGNGTSGADAGGLEVLYHFTLMIPH